MGSRSSLSFQKAARSLSQEPTVEALTGRRAITEIFPESSQQEIEHIALAQKAALLVTCPASADILAKYACGIADDPLALVALAFGAPHVIAPAMNHRMWEHPATRENVKLLEDGGCIFVGPDKGMMACGEQGLGTSGEQVEEIYGRICAELGKNGPTGWPSGWLSPPVARASRLKR